MKNYLIYLLAAISLLVISCQKELSFEGSNTPAKGSLQSDITGDCLPKTVNGTYVASSPLVSANNTITVQVNVGKTGTYVVGTDTVNGFFFRGTGTFTALGATNVTLRGNGTPFVAGVSNFVVSFDTTFCDIAVTVLPAASGPAVFTLVSGGTPSNCASAIVTGTYPKDNPLNGATSFADIMVNVATIGTYTIKATGGGMTFLGNGTFSATGNQTVRLAASGTPTTLGANTITFDPPFQSCSFTVTVTAGAAFTIDCPNVVVNGTYQVGTPLGASNSIDIPITVTTPGPYSISLSINGMTFAGSGTLTLASTLITLTGTGTPAGPAGIKTLAVGTCSIPITVAAAPVINWSLKVGAITYQGSTLTASLTASAPLTGLDYEGDNAAADDFIMQLIDLTGGINANETYDTRSQGLTNVGLDFEFYDGAGTLSLLADPFDTSVGIIFKVTSHHTGTKTIIGTFSGTAFDSVSGTIKTVTNGTFTIVYP